MYWHLRCHSFVPKKEPQPSDGIVYWGILQTNRSDRSMEPVWPVSAGINTPSLVLGWVAFVTSPWIALSPRPPPLCLSLPVLLFREDFVHGLLRPRVGFDWERMPYPPRALWAFWINPIPSFLCPCAMDLDFVFGAQECEGSTSSLLRFPCF